MTVMESTDIITGQHLKNKTLNLDTLFSRLPDGHHQHKTPKSPQPGYDFNHPYRGMAIIISNENFQSQSRRQYADTEIKKMREMFQKLNFIVFSFKDLTKKQMVDVLKKASTLTFHHQSDCFACVIGSHGQDIDPRKAKEYKGIRKVHVLFGTDEKVETNELTEIFSDDKCPDLIGKPKLFFIQACRKDGSLPANAGIDLGVERNCSTEIENWLEENMTKASTITEGTARDSQTLDEDVFEEKNLCEGTISKNTRTSSVEDKCENARVDESTGIRDPAEGIRSSSISVLRSLISSFRVRQSSPVCGKNSLIMYSTPPGMFSFGRDNVGGFMLHSLYSVLVLEETYRLQETEDGLDLLDVITRVSDFGSKTFTANIEIQGLETKSKSAFVVEHKLIGDVILRAK